MLSDVNELWRIFRKFDGEQIFACANQTDVRIRRNWYQNSSVRFPFYGLSNLNSGVLLMNLTRMREFNFVEKISLIFDQYKDTLVLVDQDILRATTIQVILLKNQNH